MIYLETSRLQLRDWEPFRRLNAYETVMEYFSKLLSPEKTDLFYKSIVTENKEYAFGLYAIEEKVSKDFIGFTNILFRGSFYSKIRFIMNRIRWKWKVNAN